MVVTGEGDVLGRSREFGMGERTRVGDGRSVVLFTPAVSYTHLPVSSTLTHTHIHFSFLLVSFRFQLSPDFIFLLVLESPLFLR